MENDRRDYVPALGYRWLTPLYDPLLRLTTRETKFKRALLRQARIRSGHRVLDLGCGTGTLTSLINSTCPEAEVIGLDADKRILEIARRKAARAGLSLRLDHGMAYALPYTDNSFDRVLSSLLFHHLTREDKLSALREVLRVLRPGGELHIADWGKPQNGLMRLAFLGVQLLDSFHTTADNVKGLLPELCAVAGLQDVEETARYATLFGTLSLYRARSRTGCHFQS